MEAHRKCPTLHNVHEADGVIELHVDDGQGVEKRRSLQNCCHFFLRR